MNFSYFTQLIICFLFLILLWAVAYFLKKRNPFHANLSKNKMIEIMDMQPINKNASLVVARVENCQFVLCLNEQTVCVIHQSEIKL